MRLKLEDPAYSSWFLHYSAVPPVNGTSYFSPPCDPNFDPPLCSSLYHDSTQSPDFDKAPGCRFGGDCAVQVPGFPYGDGNCSAPACDVGAVPVGEYVFDRRGWNVSVNGQTMRRWWIDEYLFGPLGAGTPNITGFYFDDLQDEGLCSEMDSNQAADLGLTGDEQGAIGAAFQSSMADVYTEMTARGVYAAEQFTDVNVPGNPDECARLLRFMCSPASAPPSFLVEIDNGRPTESMAVWLLATSGYGYYG